MTRNIKQQNSFLEHIRVPPQACDLEENVLGVLLSYPKYINEDSLKHLKPEYFYKEHHQIILKAILYLNEKNITVDLLSVTSELKKRKQIEEIGGAYEVTRLSGIDSIHNFIHNLLIVRQMYIYRDIIKISSEAIQSSYEMSKDVFDLIDETSDKVLALTPEAEEKKDTKTTVNHAIQDIFLRAEGKIKSIWKTGYKKWDERVSMSPGIMVFGGASGVGKTTFITFLMSRLLKLNPDVSIQWVTIDHETGATIMRKFFSQSLHVTGKDLVGQGKKIGQQTLDKLIGLKDHYNKYDIEFVEKTDYVWNIAKKFKAFVKARKKENLKILLIDNLMKIKKQKGTRNEVSEDNAVMLGELQNELRDENVLLIIIHHFNKEQLSKENAKEGFRPTRSHLRDSNVLDQIADQVILINRPGKYNEVKSLYDHEFLESFIITDVAKSSFDVEEPIYWWSHLAYTIYDEIDLLNK